MEDDLKCFGKELDDQIAENAELKKKLSAAEDKSLKLQEELSAHQNSIILIEDQNQFVME